MGYQWQIALCFMLLASPFGCDETVDGGMELTRLGDIESQLMNILDGYGRADDLLSLVDCGSWTHAVTGNGPSSSCSTGLDHPRSVFQTTSCRGASVLDVVVMG